MALQIFLILRKPRSGCLEGRTALIQPSRQFLPGVGIAFTPIVGSNEGIISTAIVPFGNPKMRKRCVVR